MAFTLYSLIQAAVLCVNAVAVLHEERFLSKKISLSPRLQYNTAFSAVATVCLEPSGLIKQVGWGVDQSVGGFGDEPGVKAQMMNLVRSVRTVMRVPLIAVNSVCIVLLLLFG